MLLAAMSIWYFVRHAQSTANLEGWLAGQIDAPLSDLGWVQAKETARTIAQLTPRISRVLSSDLQRCRCTARCIADSLGLPIVEEMRELREQHLGDWQGQSLSQIQRIGRLDDLRSWRFSPPHGESLCAVANRISVSLAQRYQGIDTVVVTHKNVLRAIIGLLRDMSDAELMNLRLPDGTIIREELGPDRWASQIRDIDL
jgi:broad specificity phosphatase PhoE